MYRLAVDPAYRRRAVASGLVREGERRLAEQGCRRVTALVLKDEGQATAAAPRTAGSGSMRSVL